MSLKAFDAADYRLDKKQIRAAFQRAARSYDAAARVQQETGERLWEHLEPVRIEPAVIVDLGAGTGELSRRLAHHYRRARVVALDLSEAMLGVAREKSRRLFSRQRFICADAESLPLASASADLLISNATLQWCNQLDRVFAESLRVLKPGGLLMFSTFGPDTLRELRLGLASFDPQPRVHAFMDMHDLGDALVGAGFSDVVMDTARLTAEYESVEELLAELKSIGATNALQQRPRGLGGKARLARLASAYEQFRRGDRLPATFEAVFAHAWKPAPRSTGVGVAPPRR